MTQYQGDPLNLLLSRLEGVKQHSARYMARCPAHADRDPSLSIRETAEGTILLHCWAGCETRDVLAAVGLEMRDLFPNDGKRAARKGPSRAAIEFERCVVAIGQAALARAEILAPADLERLELAHQRLAGVEARV